MKLWMVVKPLLLSALLLNVSCSYSYDCQLIATGPIAIGSVIILVATYFVCDSFFHIDSGGRKIVDGLLKTRLYEIKKFDARHIPVMDLEKQIMKDTDRSMFKVASILGSTGVLMLLSGLTAAVMNSCW